MSKRNEPFLTIGEIEYGITQLPVHQLRSLVISIQNEIGERE